MWRQGSWGGGLTHKCPARTRPAMSPHTHTSRLVTLLVLLTVVAAASAAAAAGSDVGASGAAVTAAIEACRKPVGEAEEDGEKSGALQWGVFDAHLHLTGRTPSQSGADLLDELEDARVDGGLLYSVYGPTNPYGADLADANEEVERIISSGGEGRILGLASLNTSDWSDGGAERQLTKLRDYLERPGFVGVKLAPPHTCLPLDGPIMKAVIEAVNQTTLNKGTVVDTDASPAVFIHTGTTPFCPGGLFGGDANDAASPSENIDDNDAAVAAAAACCEDEHVNLARLEPLIARFDRLPWALLHSGYDFTPSNRTDITDQALRLADTYPNVYLEVSAMFATEVDGTTFRYSIQRSQNVLRDIQTRGLVNRTMFGSDANWSVGGVERTLRLTVQAMLELDFTQPEICRVLGGTASEALSLKTQQ